MSPDPEREPTPWELRYFGTMLAGFFVLLGAIARQRWGAPRLSIGLWFVAAAVIILYYALPPVRRPIFRGWRTITLPVQRTTSLLALASVYYLVFTPVGLVMRAFGRDALKRGRDPGAGSYFVKRRPSGDPARYFRQF
jgi:hypothetical protein